MKKIIYFLTSILFLFSMQDVLAFAGGLGTKESPYLINDASDLNNVRHHLNSYFKLEKDIDLSYDTKDINGLFYNGGSGFEPLGSELNDFTGYFDGNGHHIIGLTINRCKSNYIGLFGQVRSASIINVVMEEVSICGESYVGSIVGNAIGSDIHHVVVANGIVRGSQVYIGGIAGANQFGTLYHAYNASQVISNSSIVFGAGAGITGLNYFGTIYDVYNIGKIENLKAEDNIGGIVGYHYGGSIKNAYTTTKTAVKTVHGLVLNTYQQGESDANQQWSGVVNKNGTQEIYEVDIKTKTVLGLKKLKNEAFTSAVWTYKEGYLPKLTGLYYVDNSGIIFEEKNVRLSKLGDIKTLKVTVLPVRSTNQKVIFESSNSDIVSVSINGEVQSKNYGTVTILAYTEDGSFRDECIVSTIQRGDVNKDGKITLSDLIKLRRYLAKIDSNSDDIEVMDVNADGRVTTTDLIKLRRSLAKLEELQ